MLATIGLNDVRLHAPHGFFEEEHLMGNEFSIDVEVEAEIGGAASDDDLGQTVNYATIHYLLKAEMKQPTQLLEALAYRMASRIANQFDNVRNVKLRLHKLNPPLGGKVGSSWVEVNVAASGGGYGDYGGGSSGRPFTFEDYVPHYDVDGAFAGPGGSRSVPRPAPIAPFTPPSTPPPPPPALVFADDAFDDDDDFDGGEFADDGLFFDDGGGDDGAGLEFEVGEPGDYEDDGDFDLDDFALPEGFDPNNLPDLDSFDFDAFDFDEELPE